MVGVGVLIRDENRFLIIKRAVDPDAGLWSIPGGLVEIGEKAAGAAVREAKEETSLDVEIIDILDIVDRIIRDENGRIRFHFVIVDFLARPRGGVVKASSDALEARWIRSEEFPSYELTPTLIDLLKRMDIYPEPRSRTANGGC
jgi:ADP-ribose pyrophosphatase YjhB (NUDIX family)